MSLPAPPDLIALRLLVDVADGASLTVAARRQGFTQQAASSRVAALERRIGVTLLERSTRGATPTASGRVVAGWALDVLDAADRLEVSLGTLRADAQLAVRIAASMTVAEHLVPRWLTSWRAERAAAGGATPDVTLTATNSAGVVDAVRRGDAALGVLETPRVPADLEARTVGHDELVLVVAPGHPWGSLRGPLPAAELAATPLTSRERGSGTRLAYEQALERLDPPLVASAPAAELPTAAAIRVTVATGGAPAVMSRIATADDLAAGRLVEVAVADVDLVRPLTLVKRRGTVLTGAAREWALHVMTVQGTLPGV